MKARTVSAVAALLVAFIGLAVVVFYARGADARAVADQRPVQVYLSVKLVPAGTSAAAAVSQGLIVKVPVAAKGVPAGSLAVIDAANGPLVATTDIASGEFVLASRFGTTRQAVRSLDVPTGMVALAIALTEPAKVGQFITPGTHIVLYDTFTPVGPAGAPAGSQAAASLKVTRVLLEDVLVIGVGATSLQPAAEGAAKQDASAPGASLVTVAVPPASALRLVQASQTGTLYAGLRSSAVTLDSKAQVDQHSLFTR